MKKSLLFCGILMVSAVGFADIAPRAGEKIQTQISDNAARILFDSFTEAEQTLAPEYTVKGRCGDVTTGKVHVTDSKESTVRLTCSVYYCMGHHASCTLEETFK